MSFFLLPPESPLAAELVAGTEHEAAFKELKEAVEQVSSIDRQGSAREKHGVFTGRYVINPINGRPAPIWVADYVLLDYGTGAVMGVPCGDQRDFDFAKKYGLEIAPIICEKEDPLYEELKDERELRVTSVDWDKAMVAEGYLVQSGEFTGLKGGKHSEAEAAIISWLEERGAGRKKVQLRLRDWLISRQRYWGNPIPMIDRALVFVEVRLSTVRIELEQELACTIESEIGSPLLNAQLNELGMVDLKAHREGEVSRRLLEAAEGLPHRVEVKVGRAAVRRANHTRDSSRLGRIKHLEAHLKALGPVVHNR